MTLEKIPRWETKLWSYISQADGMHCPAYSHCQVRLKGGWCADDNRKILEQVYRDDDFRPEKYRNIVDATHSATSEMAKRIEKLAWWYLKQGNCYCPPVSTELVSLADDQKPIKVRLLPLKAYHGAIWRLNGGWVIQLKDDDTSATKRFTLFHEAFHILAHCRSVPVFRKRGVEQGYFNELLADYFAACVLMPRRWVMEKWAEVQDLDKMAEIFVAPKGAMWFQLKLLGLI